MTEKMETRVDPNEGLTAEELDAAMANDLVHSWRQRALKAEADIEQARQHAKA